MFGFVVCYDCTAYIFSTASALICVITKSGVTILTQIDLRIYLFVLRYRNTQEPLAFTAGNKVIHWLGLIALSNFADDFSVIALAIGPER